MLVLRYLYTKERFLSCAVGLFACSLFVLAYFFLTFISYADEPSILSSGFWAAWGKGQAHMIVFESGFWAWISENLFLGSMGMLLNATALIWSCITLSLLFWQDKKRDFGVGVFFLLGCITVFFPYAVGMLKFTFAEIPLKESGPLIAMMWLSMFYAVLPVSFGLIKKINRVSNA